jgi:TrmH family RNA methyltransferase
VKPDGLISSLQNPQVKLVRSLEKARERRRQQLFVIEGRKELRMAIEAGYSLHRVFICETLISPDEVQQLHIPDTRIVRVTPSVFRKLVVRENSGGVVAVAAMKSHHLHELRLSSNPLLLVLEAVEKPGNLGAILRSADAAGVDAVICCDPATDIYNPNVIRASLGCVFTTPLAVCTSEEAITWLRQNHIRIIGTYLHASVPYTEVDFTKPSAIVMGTEAAGLSEQWVKNADVNIIIPMHGKIDSMNVSTSAAVVVFEARRQRSLMA